MATIFLLLLSAFLILKSEAVINNLNSSDYNRMPNIYEIDDYHKCMGQSNGLYCVLYLELFSEPNNTLYHQIQEYTAHHIHHYNYTVLDRGVCVQKSCNTYLKDTNYEEKDLIRILGACLNKTIFDEYGLYARIKTLHHCTRADDTTKIDQYDLIAAAVVISLILMNLAGSCYHLYLRKNNLNENQTGFLLSFSIFKNWLDLRNNQNQFKVLDGIRVVTLLTVILSHTIASIHIFGDDMQASEKFMQIIGSYILPVTYINFALSGFLQAYVYSNNANISWRDLPTESFKRFIRCTPSYAVVMLLSISWVRHIGSGPLWGLYVRNRIKDCHRFFWHHIFYFNNYIPEDLQCSVPTWFSAADMQLFIVGLVVLCLIKRRRLLVLSCLLVLGYASPLTDVWLKGLHPIGVVTPEMLRNFTNETFRYSHIRGHNNLPCYIAGMIIGLLVREWKKKGLKFQNKRLVWFANLAPFAIFTQLASHRLLYAGGPEPSLLTQMIFAVVYRIVISAIISFFIIVAVMDCDSACTRLHAWSGWELPSKLAYSVYLIHMELIYILLGTRPGKGNITTLNVITTFFGVTVCSFLLAFPLYILVEYPFNSLLKKKTTDKAKEGNKKAY